MLGKARSINNSAKGIFNLISRHALSVVGASTPRLMRKIASETRFPFMVIAYRLAGLSNVLDRKTLFMIRIRKR